MTIAFGGVLTATGQSPSFQLKPPAFNFSIWGTFVGTVTLERSFDGGTTWINASATAAGNPNSYTAPVSMVVSEPEYGVLYRVNCTAFTSGTINWRASQ